MPQQVARLERGVLQAGLFVDVYIGVSDALLKQLWKRNQPVPPAVFATFIVDTGADRTLVDEQIARTLGLIAVNQKPVITSESRGIPQICDIYAISIEARNGGSPPWRMSTVAATGRPLMDDARHGVLGRDVLDRVKLVYDGPRRTFTIDYFY